MPRKVWFLPRCLDLTVLTLRQHRTPASSLHNRENQRRSRARHREFVEDLQRRIRDYESRGVQATLQMQKVARDVAAENTALRALLANNGISREEIEVYLASSLEVQVSVPHDSSSRQSISAPSQVQALKLLSTDHQSRSGSESGHRTIGETANDQSTRRSASPNLQFSGSPVDLSTLSLGILPRSPSRASSSAQTTTLSSNTDMQVMSNSTDNGQSSHLYQLRDNGTSQEQPVGQKSCTNASESDVDSTGSHMPCIDPACYCPSEPEIQSLETSLTVMPCEEAAFILAQLRGQPDSTLVREALGCPGLSDCLVRNTAVLELMDVMTSGPPS
jgi:hypothetical protein